ncbi:unnamed protein product [Ilex paraguariensis]|uniref:Uncharacterized protein n=1 Tax=Ilex paraguariensis TaxID=185542 RepID=A0ABC8RGQ3_9AQUA
MVDLDLSISFLFCLLPLLLLLFFVNSKSLFTSFFSSNSTTLPKSYPVIGSYFAILANKDRGIQWITDVVTSTPTSTFVLHGPFGKRQVFTANPSNVQHILKTHFHVYQKGEVSRRTLKDLLGDGIFNVNGDTWKFQRHVASQEFNTKCLRKFVETVVDTELSDCLIPILSLAASNKTVLDFQDLLQRFAFDNICRIAFGYDPACLLPSLPQSKFADAFDEAVQFSAERGSALLPLIWKMKKFFNIGSEKRLRMAVNKTREFAKEIIKEKKQELNKKSSLDSVDLLSRFLSSGHSEVFVADIVVSFILAGRDTTSMALTWFFWLLYNHPDVEHEILREIGEISEESVYDEVKDMVYTHASLCESMRLYPPVPLDSKEATEDDNLPDGTAVKKGTEVAYHPYAMGRMEKLWGPDWAEFRPKRWLERDTTTGKWSFVARDPYMYPVFQAGPRICLGKEMAFLQMKRVVAGVLRQYRVVPVVEEGDGPVFLSPLSMKMKGGLPVRIEERGEKF